MGKKSVASSLAEISDLLLGQALAITNSDLKGEELKEEVARSGALADIAGRMIEVNKTIVSAAKVQAEFGNRGTVAGVALLTEGKRDE